MPRVDDGPVAGGWRVPGVYRALLEWERGSDARHGGDPREILSPPGVVSRPVFRRSRLLLDALEAGEPVTVPGWRLGGHGAPRVPIPRELRCWPNRFVVSPDDVVRPSVAGIDYYGEL